MPKKQLFYSCAMKFFRSTTYGVFRRHLGAEIIFLICGNVNMRKKIFLNFVDVIFK